MATKKVRKLVLVQDTGKSELDAAQDFAGKELTSTEEVEQVQEQMAAAAAKPVVLDGTLEVIKDKKTRAVLVRAEKKLAAKVPQGKAEQGKAVAGKTQILDAAKVMEIIALSDAGSKPSEIAKLYGVAPSHVSNIVRGVSWCEVTGRHYVKGNLKASKTPAATAPVTKPSAAKPTTGKANTHKGSK